MPPEPGPQVRPGLTPDERQLLNRGLFAWMGGSYLTDALAVAMGFESAVDFDVEADRLASALAADEPLSGWDWTRTLLATEIAFASDVLGLGVEWETITGLGDQDALEVLCDLQRELVRVGPVLAFGPRLERSGTSSLNIRFALVERCAPTAAKPQTSEGPPRGTRPGLKTYRRYVMVVV